MNQHADIASNAEGPCDPAAEIAVLALIVKDNRNMRKVMHLSPEQFTDPLYAATFASMRELDSQGKEITLPSLMARTGASFYTGGNPLSDYTFEGRVPRILDVADSVVEKAIRRRLKAVGANLAGEMDNLSNPLRQTVQSILDTAKDETRSLGLGRGDIPNWSTAVDAVEDYLFNDRGFLTKTGLRNLDSMIGGWKRSNYALIGARPSMGKTTVAIDFSMRAFMRNVGVAFVSMEMNTAEISLRMGSRLTKIKKYTPTVPYSKVSNNEASDQDKRSLMRALKDEPLNLFSPIGNGTSMDVGEITRQVERVQEDMDHHGVSLGLVIIDHVGHIRKSGKWRGSMVNEIGEISRQLQDVAKGLDVQVLALSQLNRDNERTASRRPELQNLRNSGDLEQDADVVMLLHRDAYYLEKAKGQTDEEEIQRLSMLEAKRDELEIIVAKNRSGGRTGTAYLECDLAYNHLQDFGSNEPRMPESM